MIWIFIVLYVCGCKDTIYNAIRRLKNRSKPVKKAKRQPTHRFFMFENMQLLSFCFRSLSIHGAKMGIGHTLV